MSEQPITMTDMIKEVGREIGIRRGYYPKAIAAGRLPSVRADRQIAVLEMVYEVLKRLEATKWR